ncbi:Integrase catalytic core protein [Phytophthora palmivora]|uniref:Integrase catalytic core protein n=1 Tax=Phytophthora palmivora TaxID=4796 RepID=A0A2P4XCI6_9STRA|nr:Integrase catalytic core protein [Phytophthora palmivora]
MNRDCPSENDGIDNDAVLAAKEGSLSGWQIDSGATSHMAPYRTVADIEVTIAGGKKLRVAGQGTVRLTSLNGKHIEMIEVLYTPERGLTVEFQRSSCVIWSKTCAIAAGRQIGKAYMLDYEEEEARFVEYAGTGSQWELWHARIGHPSDIAMIRTQRIT